jgi:hypothetical protein
MPKFSVIRLATLLVGASLYASGANAAFITYTSESAWDKAVGASTVEDFNSITSVTSFTTSPLTVGNLTLSGFTPSNPLFNIGTPTDCCFNHTTTHVSFATSSVIGDQFRVDFGTGVSAWGADITNFEPSRGSSFAAFDSNHVALGTMNAYDASNNAAFHGFELTSGDVASDIVFNSNTLDEFAGLDDAKFVTADATVPEPGSMLIFGLGLIGLGYIRRRKAA